jgi:hypothetical protein
LEQEVRKVERACGRDVVGKEARSTGGVVLDGFDNCSSRTTQGGHQEDLNHLEGKVVVLYSQFHSRPSRATRDLGCEAKDDGQQSHEDRKQDDRQQTSDETDEHLGQVVNERERGDDLDELVDLGNSTNGSDWDCPENDESDDERNDNDLADNTLPPLDVQVAPDDLGRCHSSITGLHVQDVVMGQALVCSLRFVHRGELNKGSSK